MSSSGPASRRPDSSSSRARIPHVTRLVVERALAANPAVDFVVRTHSDTEAAHLRAIGGRVQAVHGERELAVQMVRYALRRFGVDAREAEAIAQGIRRLADPGHPTDGRRRACGRDARPVARPDPGSPRRRNEPAGEP